MRMTHSMFIKWEKWYSELDGDYLLTLTKTGNHDVPTTFCLLFGA